MMFIELFFKYLLVYDWTKQESLLYRVQGMNSALDKQEKRNI